MTTSTYSWQSGQNGLDKLTLSHNGTCADVYRHGAHVTSWRTSGGREWIFLSRAAQFDAGKAIRGGVPVIFPQFNERGTGPRHGFARTTSWQLPEPPTTAHCRLRLAADETTRTLWPHEFEALYDIALDAQGLSMVLNVCNLGNTPFTFTAALHTYLRLDNLHSATVSGLKGCAYWDNDGTPFDQREVFSNQKLPFQGAIDRVFFETATPLELVDGASRLRIEHDGFRDTVIWNPGLAAAQAFADMEGEEYRHMLCIEAAQIDKPVTLAPGEHWTGAQRLHAD